MPGLSAFMLSAWAAKSGMPAAARKWSLEPAASRFTLTLAPSNRWCPPPPTHTHHTAHPRALGSVLQLPWGSCLLDVQSRGLPGPCATTVVCVEKLTWPSLSATRGERG